MYNEQIHIFRSLFHVAKTSFHESMKSVLLTEKNTRMLLKDENIKSESFCNIINCET